VGASPPRKTGGATEDNAQNSLLGRLLNVQYAGSFHVSKGIARASPSFMAQPDHQFAQSGAANCQKNRVDKNR
jgi:hypothetical protein